MGGVLIGHKPTPPLTPYRSVSDCVIPLSEASRGWPVYRSHLSECIAHAIQTVFELSHLFIFLLCSLACQRPETLLFLIKVSSLIG